LGLPSFHFKGAENEIESVTLQFYLLAGGLVQTALPEFLKGKDRPCHPCPAEVLTTKIEDTDLLAGFCRKGAFPVSRYEPSIVGDHYWLDVESAVIEYHQSYIGKGMILSLSRCAEIGKGGEGRDVFRLVFQRGKV
jgi:hypothetical protein